MTLVIVMLWCTVSYFTFCVKCSLCMESGWKEYACCDEDLEVSGFGFGFGLYVVYYLHMHSEPRL